jgi:ferritin-like metal-binding protein YciE
MKIDSMEKFFYEELKDIYDAEKQLTKAIPKMAKAANSEELRAALEEHLEVTEKQVTRLEEVFDLIGQPAKGKTCAGMKGLIAEGNEAVQEDASEVFQDAAIIGAAQRVEHYEIAAYGVVREIAERMGNQQAADLLEETLNEEKEADEKLNEVAASLYEEYEEDSEAVSEEEDEEEEAPARMQKQGRMRKAS